MSRVADIANSLMLDFRCIIVPRFVYAVGSAFRDGAIADGKVAQRIDQLAHEFKVAPFHSDRGGDGQFSVEDYAETMG